MKQETELGTEHRYYYLLILFGIAYVVLTFLTPSDPKTLVRYNLSELHAKLLGFTFVVPIIAIWYAAFFGFIKVKAYAESIKKSPDGQALSILARGLMILSVGLPISTLVPSLLTLAVRNELLDRSFQTIVTTYIGIVISILAYWFLFIGSRKLLAIVEKKSRKSGHTLLFWVFLIPTAIAYVVLIYNAIETGVPAQATPRTIDILPSWLVFLTIVLPYIAMWFLGFQAAFNTIFYRAGVQGIIYKQALNFLALGIFALIFSSIFLQFLTALSQFLQDLALGPLLIVVYILLLIIAIGYIFIAYGAKLLKKIEEAV